MAHDSEVGVVEGDVGMSEVEEVEAEDAEEEKKKEEEK